MAATAHMARPYPSIYHTPQSNSPASVASPQSHDQHGRGMYPPPGSQIPQSMYGYQYPSMNQVHQSPYGGHQSHPQQSPQQQPHHLNSQSMMISHAPPAPMHQQGSSHQSGVLQSPRIKSDPTQQPPPHPQSQTPQLQQQQRPSISHTQHGAPPGTPSTAGSLPPPGQNPPGGNSNAAPGPIPATTPLVVRQDNNGVQWIAFEYSRDRVKMEYTIRCDVESVKVDLLSQEFKVENCVYPRACCNKDQYKGNRLNYESDCNSVGWALAELNPCLRGKRGLIQRAVDSWRNSNQDPKLRSRRVRRQAKINKAKPTPHANAMTAQASQAPNGLPGPNTTMAAPTARPSAPLGMGSQQMHHHHAHNDGHQESVSGMYRHM